jgi:hypothetical protein
MMKVVLKIEMSQLFWDIFFLENGSDIPRRREYGCNLNLSIYIRHQLRNNKYYFVSSLHTLSFFFLPKQT